MNQPDILYNKLSNNMDVLYGKNEKGNMFKNQESENCYNVTVQCQGRIQDFPVARQLQKGGVNVLFCQNFLKAA